MEIDGATYTSLAVSYRNKTIEELIGGQCAYGGQSDCYIIYPDGDVMLSEEPKSEIEDWMDNLFDYLQKYAQVDAGRRDPGPAGRWQRAAAGSPFLLS